MGAKPGLRGRRGSTCHMAQRRAQERKVEQQNKSTHAFKSMRISHSTAGEDASVTVCCQDENVDGKSVKEKPAAHNQNRFGCYDVSLFQQDMSQLLSLLYFLQNIFADPTI